MGTQQLQDCELWWKGPSFFLQSPRQDTFTPVEAPPEMNCKIAVVNEYDVVIPRCATFEKTVRVMAYVLRFKDSLKSRGAGPKGQLTINELQTATTVLLKNLQSVCFYRELRQLKRNQCVHRASKLITLNPLLDDHGLISVGGRWALSDLTAQRRCPIVLPSGHWLTKLLILSVHMNNLHAGAQCTLAAVRQRFWPTSGRRTVREVLRTCVKFIRARPQFHAPLMGALPAFRVRPTRPFHTSGVDYCGPFIIKEGSRRSKRTIKAYVCIFVCCSTKAVHIELVSNLSTDCFLAALNRFISRRGIVSEIISDNATNFEGARNQLEEIDACLAEHENVNTIETTLSQKRIKWTFITPRAPHFGGLWEVAVKSVKSHFHRVTGKAMLTTEKFGTLLIQIEAVFNSRPLLPTIQMIWKL